MTRSARLEPLSPARKWRAITIATLVFAPGYWAMLAGLVALASDQPEAESAGAAVAFGLAVVPFVFITLAFLSQHPEAPRAVLRAMGLALLVGPVTSAFAGDGVTGIIAGVGAGGVVALRRDELESTGARWCGVAAASAYTLVLVRLVGAVALVPAVAFPLTALGVADHLVERRREREGAAPSSSPSAPRAR